MKPNRHWRPTRSGDLMPQDAPDPEEEDDMKVTFEEMDQFINCAWMDGDEDIAKAIRRTLKAVEKWQRVLKESNEITLFVIRDGLLDAIRDFDPDKDDGDDN